MALFNLVSVKDFIPRTFELFQKGEGKGYSRAAFGKDCVAGLTVGVVALPLAMAFSIAAGGTPAQGLYTAIAAGFAISVLGGSKFQIGGPTGAFVVIIFGIIARHGMAGLTIATLLAGLMLIVMGLTGLGRFIRFIPYPVTTGFTTGIGLLIFSQQIKDFFGLTLEKSSPEFLEMWKGYFGAAATIRPLTLLIGLGTVGVIALIRKFAPRIPGAVVGVIAATLICHFLSLDTETIGTRFGGIPRSLPAPVLPAFSWPLIQELLRDSFAIALLAAIESLLSAVVADGMTGDRHNANMELVAQGVGNIAGALFGGIPATGAIARTATNIKSGAASPVAGIIHALTLLLFMMFLAPLASAIPLVSLSAVLIVISWDMSNIPRFLHILIKAPKSDATVLLVTFALTVMVDLPFAVEVGVILAAFLFLRRMIEVADIKPGVQSIGSEIVYGRRRDDHRRNPDGLVSGGQTSAPENSIAHAKNIEVYDITGPFFFGVADTLQRVLRSVAQKPHAFVLRMRDVPAIDSTGIAALESFLAQCRHGKIRLILCEVREHPFSALKKSGFIAELGEDNVAASLEAAFRQAEEP
ncbi:sodium-independent anion transporter [Spirochaetia bacterium]|nr:sodium-independent anion transporter [Spirochaetia bacterium]